jgi:hypothetical protein
MRMRYAVLALTAIMGMSGAFAQCLITGFEGYTLGANGVVLFRQPSFSGSTSSFVVGGACNIPNGVYNCALISDEQAFSGTQSLKVAWQFRTDANGNPFPNAWLRLTTFNTTSVPNPAITFAQRVRVRLYVPSDTPDFYLTLGVRETGTTAACAGNGGTSGGIEWIGATSAQAGPSAPVGKLVNQKDQWVTVKFDASCDPIRAFAGATANGQLDTERGTLEQLAFTPTDPANLGPYIVYIDDVETYVPTPGDVDDNGCVDDADLLQVLFAFGSTGSNDADVNCDQVVDDADLLIVLFNFGTGC